MGQTAIEKRNEFESLILVNIIIICVFAQSDQAFGL